MADERPGEGKDGSSNGDRPAGVGSWRPPGAASGSPKPVPPKQPTTAKGDGWLPAPRQGRGLGADRSEAAARGNAAATPTGQTRSPARGSSPRPAPRHPGRPGFRARATASRKPFAIPRSQQWLFAIMFIGVVAMAASLLHMREQTKERFEAATAPLPPEAAGAREQELSLYLARDLDGSLIERQVRFPSPADANARARVVLERLLAEYTAAGSPHPLHPSGGVENVFLLPVPGGGGQMAVVNLSSSFTQNHPSGVEPETLTLLSMIATLKANLPAITQVRFLVDGERRSTLAGHADLARAYLASSAQMQTLPRAARPEADGNSSTTDQP